MQTTKERRRKELEERGFLQATVGDWLDLTPEQVEMIEMRVALATMLRRLREREGMTQTDVARLLETSQPRVSKMESGDPSVTIDLLIRALLVLGVPRSKIARALAARTSALCVGVGSARPAGDQPRSS